jgi:CHAD domain-containing protein
VRDLDVYLADGPPDPALEPLWAVLEARHRAAQAALVAALDSERRQRFDVLVTTVTRPRSVPTSSLTTSRWAAKAVGKAHRRLLEAGRAATGAAELHEVRKAGKRLRYLLDAFSPVLGQDGCDAVIADLKSLQNVLGDLQDSAVHAALLTGVGAELEGAAPATFIAIGRLVELEDRRQRKAISGFADRFERFAAEWGDLRALLERPERS